MAAPERVAPGVYRVDAIGFPNAISVLLVKDGDGWTLIDTGIASSAGRIRKALVALGGETGGLEARVSHTPPRGPHRRLTGGAGVGAERRTGDVGARAEVISGRRGPDPPSNALSRYASRYQKLPTAPIDSIAREGDVVAGFRVVLTPGHTSGHASLLRDEDGLLFTGDAFGVLLRRIRVGVYKAPGADPPLAKRSAERLLAEEFVTVLMSHGRPLYADTQRQLR